MNLEWPRAIAKCVLLFGASVSVGLVSSAAALLSVVGVNEWDDAPGGGFLVFGVLILGGLAGCIAGICSAAVIWSGRAGGANRAQAAADLWAIQWCVLSASLIMGAASSIFTRRTLLVGGGFGLTLFAMAVLLLRKAARLTVLRSPAK